jgi:hypothetical protein
MESIIQQVRKLAETADEAGRQELLLTLRNVAHSIEKPRDTVARKIFPVRINRSISLPHIMIFNKGATANN